MTVPLAAIGWAAANLLGMGLLALAWLASLTTADVVMILVDVD